MIFNLQKKIIFSALLMLFNCTFLNAYMSVLDIEKYSYSGNNIKETKQLLLELAKNGDTEAMYELSDMYQLSLNEENNNKYTDDNNRIIKFDRTKKLNWLKLSATLGNKQALIELSTQDLSDDSLKYWWDIFIEKFPEDNIIEYRTKRDELIKKYTLEDLNKAKQYEELIIRIGLKQNHLLKILSNKDLLRNLFTIELIQNRKYLQKLYLQEHYYFNDFFNILGEFKNQENHDFTLTKKNKTIKLAYNDLIKYSKKDQDELVKNLEELKTDIIIYKKNTPYNGDYKDKNKFINKILILQAENDFILYLGSILDGGKSLLESAAHQVPLAYFILNGFSSDSIMSFDKKFGLILWDIQNFQIKENDITTKIYTDILKKELSRQTIDVIHGVFKSQDTFKKELAVLSIPEWYSKPIKNDKEFYKYEEIFQHISTNHTISKFDEDVFASYKKIINLFSQYLYVSKNQKVLDLLSEYVYQGAINDIFLAQSSYANYLENKKKNKNEAKQWYEKAANNKEPSIDNYPAYWLGWHYFHDENMLKDYQLAMKYFLMSGIDDAKCEIANMYATGLNGTKDLAKAKEIIQFVSRISFDSKIPDVCTTVYKTFNLESIILKPKELDEDTVYAELEAKFINIKKPKQIVSKDDIQELVSNIKEVKKSNNNWLIAIGTENYDNTDAIKFSKNTTNTFVQVAQKTLGITSRNTYALIEDKSTTGAIKDNLELLIRNIKEGDTIYFYYSGHGIPVLPDNEPYILPKDKMPEMIGKDEFFKLRNIYKMLSDSKASKVVAIIDSCFSGATDGVSVVKGVAATRLKPKKVTFDTNKMVVMTAGQDKQYSNMYEEKGHRLFTYFVMKSLLKGKHNSEDIYREVYTNVKDESFKMGDMKVQEPQLEGNNKIDF